MKVTSLLLSPSRAATYHSDLCYFKPFSTSHLEQNKTVNQELEKNQMILDHLLYPKKPPKQNNDDKISDKDYLRTEEKEHFSLVCQAVCLIWMDFKKINSLVESEYRFTFLK